jgi:hypothetical protein
MLREIHEVAWRSLEENCRYHVEYGASQCRYYECLDYCVLWCGRRKQGTEQHDTGELQCQGNVSFVHINIVATYSQYNDDDR